MKKKFKKKKPNKINYFLFIKKKPNKINYFSFLILPGKNLLVIGSHTFL